MTAGQVKVSDMPATEADGGYVLISQEINGTWESRKAKIDAKSNLDVIDLRLMSNSDFVNSSKYNFSRNSDGYIWDGSQYKHYGANEPRLNHKGLLLEEQRINFLRNISTFTSSSGIRKENVTSVFENQTALKITDENVDNVWQYFTSPYFSSLTTSDYLSFNFIVEQNHTDQIVLGVRESQWLMLGGFQPSTLTMNFSRNPSNAAFSAEILTENGPNGGKVYNIKYEHISLATMTSDVRCLFYIPVSTATEEKGFVVHHIQLEKGRTVSSPIYNTTGGPLTRAADRLTISEESYLNYSEKSWAAKIYNPAFSNVDNYVLGLNATDYANDGGSVLQQDTNLIAKTTNSSGTDYTSTYGALNSQTTISNTISPNSIKWCINSEIKESTNIQWDTTNDYVEDFVNLTFNGSINGYLNIIKILPKALTDQELKGII